MAGPSSRWPVVVDRFQPSVVTSAVPPVDLVETASFLDTPAFMQERGALVFWARSVALHMQKRGVARVLPLKLPIELPPVGMITLRSRARTPACEQPMACLRAAAPASN